MHSSNKPSSRVGGQARAFARQTSANAAIEYSLILAVVAMVIVAALYSLAPGLFAGLGSDSGDFKARAQAQAQRAQNPDAQEAPSAPTETPAPQRRVPWFQLGLVGAALLASGAYYFERARTRKRAAEEAEEEEERRFRREITIDPVQQPRFIAKRQQILRFITRRQDESKTRFRVVDVMTVNLTTVSPGTKLAEIKRLVQELKLRHILVVNLAGNLVGVISDRDLANRKAKKASELMTADPLVVPPDMVVSEAIRLMVCHGISCLPVVDNGKPIGLLTTTDLLLTFQCAQQLLKQVAVAAPDASRSCSEGLAAVDTEELVHSLQA